MTQKSKGDNDYVDGIPTELRQTDLFAIEV